MSPRAKKKFIFVTMWGMILMGSVLLSAPSEWFPIFYAPRFMGVAALLFGVVIFLPQIIFRVSVEHRDFKIKQDAVRNLQTILAICFLLAGGGELGLWQLYKYGFQYDKLIHFIVPALLTISLSHFLFHWWRLRREKAIKISAIFIFIGSLVWEALEFYSDKIFGTQLFGVYGQHLSQDTKWDIFYDLAGIITGWLVLRGKLR